MNGIYMDSNATTPTDPRVVEAMLPYFDREFGNPSSAYSLAQKARAAMESARVVTGRALGCPPDAVVFTSGGSESDNIAIKGAAFARMPDRGHIITTRIEHHAVLTTCEYLERHLGFGVTYLPVDGSGLVDPADVERACRPDTFLISVMLANNEVGTIEPVAEIAAIARKRGILVHTDAVQAVGKIPVDVAALGVDLLALSGHKLYGPKGVGALYVRPGTRIHPLSHGGRHERGLRAGTENVPGIVGLGRAIELCLEEIGEEPARLRALVDRLEHGIVERVPDVVVNGRAAARLPGTLNVSFLYVEGESVVLALDMEGISVSTGSACTTDAVEPSHVLTAMGVQPNVAQGSVRMSLGRHNSDSDVDRVLEVVPGVVERLRSLSPLARRGC